MEFHNALGNVLFAIFHVKLTVSQKVIGGELMVATKKSSAATGVKDHSFANS